jgi:hypothetical protein
MEERERGIERCERRREGRQQQSSINQTVDISPTNQPKKLYFTNKHVRPDGCRVQGVSRQKGRRRLVRGAR